MSKRSRRRPVNREHGARAVPAAGAARAGSGGLADRGGVATASRSRRTERAERPRVGDQQCAVGSGSGRAAARRDSCAAGAGGPDSAGHHLSAVEPVPPADIPDDADDRHDDADDNHHNDNNHDNDADDNDTDDYDADDYDADDHCRRPPRRARRSSTIPLSSFAAVVDRAGCAEPQLPASQAPAYTPPSAPAYTPPAVAPEPPLAPPPAPVIEKPAPAPVIEAPSSGGGSSSGGSGGGSFKRRWGFRSGTRNDNAGVALDCRLDPR